MTAADGTAGSTVTTADGGAGLPPDAAGLDAMAQRAFSVATKSLEEQQKNRTELAPKLKKGLEDDQAAYDAMPMRALAEIPRGPELPKDKPTAPSPDPIQGFGSAASVLGILGSMLLKQPVSTALNASAAAMKARNANDWTTYEAKYKEWKDATDLAYKQADWEAKRFGEIMDLYKTDSALASAKLRAHGVLTGNEMLTADWIAGDPAKAGEIYSAFVRSKDAMNAHALRVQELDERERHDRATEKILGGRQTAAQQKAAVMQQDAAEAVGQMKDLLGILGTAKKPVAGVGGLVSRGVETLKTAPLTRDLFSGDPNKVDLSAHNFESKLKLLKAQLPQLLNKTGRVSNFERAQIDSAIDAVSHGSTDATAKQGIENAIKILQEKFGLNDEGKPILEKAPVEGAGPAAENPEASAILDAILGGSK